MENNHPQTGVRWSTFKIIILLVLISLSGYAIYTAVTPMIDGDYSLKSWVNIVFIALMVFFLLSIFKVRRNYQFVFWACCFGMLIFATIMFLKYDELLS